MYELNWGIITKENHDQYIVIEEKLKKIEEGENIALLKKSKQWDQLHLEKPCAAFANLLKRKNDSVDFKLITDAQGNAFNSEKLVEEHLCDFFSKFFIKVNRPEGVNLRQFLGEDIINNNIVQEKFLSNEERDALEGPITLEELWEALCNSNLSSAPGVNGITNGVLSKFWELIKWPIRDGFNGMFQKGKLLGTILGSG